MIWNALILSGLILEVVGAFALAADAIGLERIARWTTHMMRLRRGLSEEWTGSTFRDPKRFFCAFMSAGVGGGAIWIAEYRPVWIEPVGESWPIVAGGVGGVLSLILYYLVLGVLSSATHALQMIRTRSHDRTIGAFGFVVLFLGFLLQFVATAGSGLQDWRGG